MFSKPVSTINNISGELKNEFVQKSSKPPPSTTQLSYSEFNTKEIVLKKYKLPELKNIAKSHRLHITGSKTVLIERIESHFLRTKMIIQIQKVFRGHLVRYSFRLRGKGLYDRNSCVNQSDFYTLEPLTEISFDEFYSYTNSTNFTYGFNISSLILLMKNNGNNTANVNPYNREPIELSVQREIASLYQIMNIIGQTATDESNREMLNHTNTIQNHLQISTQRQRHAQSRAAPQSTPASSVVELARRMIAIRHNPINTRVVELFMEIDRLGNYTQSSWFMELNRYQYIRLYRGLYDIWNFRAQLSREVKRKICPLYDPFSNIFNEPMFYNQVSFERIQEACVIVMENMIFTGIDDEFRKIGTLHALSALTVVSHEARVSMPWLYESVAY